jgi:autophagy-related protein 2
MDSSIRALAPHHPGAMVFHVGALDFSTDIVGESPDSSFHLSVPTLALLVVDDLSDCTAGAEAQITSVGVSYWKVRPMVG